jgi:hypothetical protein
VKRIIIAALATLGALSACGGPPERALPDGVRCFDYHGAELCEYADGTDFTWGGK